MSKPRLLCTVDFSMAPEVLEPLRTVAEVHQKPMDYDTLLAALASGQLGGFGADVLHDEWRQDMTEHPVVRYARDHDNVVLTPHIGGAVKSAMRQSRAHTAKKLAAALAPLQTDESTPISSRSNAS